MESLYQSLGISRQGFHQYRRRQSQYQALVGPIVDQVKHHREDHPRMGARTLYQMMQNEPKDQVLIQQIGRDKFEQILLGNSLAVIPVRVFHKTTYSGSFRFPNLVEGETINQLNRIWVSDLTYYRLRDGWAYLTFILELYSRRCLGFACSEGMTTEETTLPALKMALKTRGIKHYQHQLCFHSDGGGQYYDKEFIKLTQQYQIKSSMAEIVYENPHMERFHSTAKNDYLIPWRINSVNQLQRKLPHFVKLYNSKRPHSKLKGKTPIAFEQHIQQFPLHQRTKLLFKKVQ